MTGHPLRWGTADMVALAALVTSSVLLRHSASTEQPTSDIAAWFAGQRATAVAATYLLGFGATVLLLFLPLDALGPLTRQGLCDDVVDMAMLFTTDPTIVSHDLVTLADEHSIQPVENSTPPVRTDTVTRWSEGRAKLTHAVSCQLTTARLGDLNATVDGEAERDPVADQWLHPEGRA